MAKKYYQSKMDRKNESAGMKRYDRAVETYDRSMGRDRQGRDYDRSLGRPASFERYMREMNEFTGNYKHGRDMHNDSRSNAQENEYTMRHNTGGYLTEDHSQVANLPQNVVYRPYGDPVAYLPQDIDDTISGIDRQRGIDMRKAMEHFFPKKV
jgi:hypothetical protein